MSKKIFVKTLLPIATVALLGGGIAASLTLTSCGEKEIRLDRTNTLDYLLSHKQDSPYKEVEYYEDGDIVDQGSFAVFLQKYFTKQAFINAAICSTYLEMDDYELVLKKNTITVSYSYLSFPCVEVSEFYEFKSIFEFKLTSTFFFNNAEVGEVELGCDINDFKVNSMEYEQVEGGYNQFSVSIASAYTDDFHFSSSIYDYTSIDF
jgi:hypothetical protein